MALESAPRRGPSTEDQAIRRILEGTVSSTGGDFFRALVRNLAEVLPVAHAWVTEFTASNTGVRALAFWQVDRFQDDIEYELVGTPCERVISGDFVHHPSGVQRLYPNDAFLGELRAEGYMGVPLVCADQVLGHLAIIDDKEMDAHPTSLAIIQIFASRAAAELWRIRIEEKVRIAERRLTGVVQSAMDAIVALDTRQRIVVFNESAERVFLAKSADVVGKPFGMFLTETSAEVLDGYLTELREQHPEAPYRRLEGALEMRRANVEGFPAEGVVSVATESGGLLYTLFLRDMSPEIAAQREIQRLTRTADYLQEELLDRRGMDALIGSSKAMQTVQNAIERVAPTDATVLILGETGSGKEIVARSLHARSARSERPFVKINCGALPPGLVESELFGHEKGAFTGATGERTGRFELADGGTLFLDEVGDIPLDAQVKLLRVLQEGEFERVGSSETRQVDVRIVAATNRDLREELASARFRPDLFYRLSVFPIEVPPLRDRQEDIPEFVRHFVDKYAARFGRPVSAVSETLLSQLVAYSWPGNVRELENVIERALILSDGPTLDLAPDTLALSAAGTSLDNGGALKEVERRHIESTLQAAGWVVDGPRGAALALGLHPSTLRNRMRKLGIRRPH